MIITILKNIFNFITKDDKSYELTQKLSKNSAFKTIEEINKNPNQISKQFAKLEKGEINTINMPNFGNLNGFYLSKRSKKNGEFIKEGEIVCEIENGEISMEMESYYTGKLIITSNLKQTLKPNDEICKIEGI